MNYNLKSNEHANALRELQKNIGYTFANDELLKEALRHPSYATEYPSLGQDNQRLEFLGDAVLELILTNYLYNNCPQYDEGTLTKMRAYLANEIATSDYARKIGLDKLLLLGKGEDANGGRQKPSLLGDVFEAFLGALYTDGGYLTAEKFCLGLLPQLDDIKQRMPQEENPKGALQEFCQEHHIGKPVYEIISKTGPVHKPTFELRLVLNNKELARTTAGSQKVAEKTVANEALKILRRSLMAKPEKQTVIGLDFDGVICDSARETCCSGWKGCRKIWPELFKEEPTIKDINAFRKIRPFLETGYHAILLNKMLQEKLPMEEFEHNLQQNYERIMAEANLDKPKLIEIMGEARDNWIKLDKQEWLNTHDFYDGVLNALATLLKSNTKVLIITTKQERFVAAVLQNKGVDFPVENILGLDRKKKKEAHLLDILSTNPGEVHFVEDRLDTLQRIEQVPELACVKLHYATWGYSTQQDNLNAAKDARLQNHTLQDFNRWLTSQP